MIGINWIIGLVITINIVNENAEDVSEFNNIEDDSYNFNTDEIITDIEAVDIYQLGSHRLICGDCLDSEIMNKLMQGRKAMMCFTDSSLFDGFYW